MADDLLQQILDEPTKAKQKDKRTVMRHVSQSYLAIAAVLVTSCGKVQPPPQPTAVQTLQLSPQFSQGSSAQSSAIPMPETSTDAAGRVPVTGGRVSEKVVAEGTAASRDPKVMEEVGRRLSESALDPDLKDKVKPLSPEAERILGEGTRGTIQHSEITNPLQRALHGLPPVPENDDKSAEMTPKTTVTPSGGFSDIRISPIAELETSRGMPLNQPDDIVELGDAKVGITDVCFDPSGKLLLTAGEDGMVRAWDTDEWKLAGEFLCNNPIAGIAFAHDGKTIVAVTKVGEMLIFDFKTKEQRHLLKFGQTHVNSFATIDGSGIDGIVLTVGVSDGRNVKSRRSKIHVTSWHLLENQDPPTASVLMVSDRPGYARIQRLTDGRTAVRGFPGVILLPREDDQNGPIVAFGSRDLDDSFVVSPEGQFAILVGGEFNSPKQFTLLLWDMHALHKVKEIGQHAAAIHDLAFASESRLVSAGGQYRHIDGAVFEPVDQTVSTWNVNTRQELQRVKLPGCPRCVDVSPDGKLIAVGTNNGVEGWQFPQGAYVWTLPIDSN